MARLRGNPQPRVVRYVALLAATFAGCATTHATPGSLWHPAPADTIPAGTLLSAQLRQAISTADNHPGDRFTADLLDPVMDGRGQPVLPRGAQVQGVVRRADRANGFGGAPTLELQVLGIALPMADTRAAPLECAQTPVELTSVAGRTVIASLAGAGIGAATGLGINHNDTGLVVGSALIGLGVGAVAGFFLGPRDAVLPAGTVLTLRVMQDVTWSKSVAQH